MTPSASSRWMRFQQGVEERPTRLPISATEWEASCCSRARILRSMASMEQAPAREINAFLPNLVELFCVFWHFLGVYLENYSPASEIPQEVVRARASEVREPCFFARRDVSSNKH